MFDINNVTQNLQTSQPIVWETYEERDGMTIIERHEIVNGVEVIDRVF